MYPKKYEELLIKNDKNKEQDEGSIEEEKDKVTEEMKTN